MKIFFNAFSFEHDPHIIVVILLKPFGATDIKTFFKRFGQSAPGNTPSAGRFTKAKMKQTKRLINYIIFLFINTTKYEYYECTNICVSHIEYTYILHYFLVQIHSAARNDYSPMELLIFAYRYLIKRFHPHQPNNCLVIYCNQQIIALHRLARINKNGTQDIFNIYLTEY